MQQPATMSWEPRRQEGESRPTPRSAHTLVISGDFAYMFGGCDKRRPPGPNGELFKLDMSDKNYFYWSKVEQTDEIWPAERWHHTAHVCDEGRSMLVFGGFSANKLQRYFNDLWLYDVATESWKQPPQAETVPDPAGLALPALKRAWPGVPEPRGAHASTLVKLPNGGGLRLMVFGGYGGAGFSRRDFSDLHALDMETMEWEEIETNGEAPEPRSGHQLLAVDDKQLYVMGGWNSSRQFDDVHVYDMASRAWSQPARASGPEYWGAPRWNYTAVAVFAVPFWKIFVFGGNTGDLVEGSTPTGDYVNDIMVLECGDNVWARPTIAGEIPSARSDAPMAYDADKGQMVMYGGWKHSWYGDLSVCNVAEVVGPPYSVDEISPGIGPVTGKTLVQLSGMGFGSTRGEVVVRYACEKGFELGSNGRVVDDRTILFETPNYEHYGAVEIECRVAIGNKGLTNSKVKMQFFSVTSSKQSLALGPGLSTGCIAGVETQILIIAKDRNGSDRSCGMDEFSVRIEPPVEDDELKNLDLREANAGLPDVDPLFAILPEETDPDELKVQVELYDNRDGTYLAQYTPPAAGEYKVYIEYMGTFDGEPGPVRGSPFSLTCVDVPTYWSGLVASGSKEVRSVDLAEGALFPEPEQLLAHNALDGNVFQTSMTAQIKEMKEFSAKKKRGLAKTLEANGPVGPLIEIKEHLRSVDEREHEFALQIDTITGALAQLKAKGNAVDRTTDQLQKAISEWSDVLVLAPETAHRIVPDTQDHGARTMVLVEQYEEKVRMLEAEFKTRSLFTTAPGSEEANKALDKASKEFEEELKVLERNARLCVVFECPEKINAAKKMLSDLVSTVDRMRTLWAVTEDIDCFVDDARNILWKELVIEDIEDGCKAQNKRLSTVNKDVRWCGCYKDTTKKLKDFINTIPLVIALRSKAMRPRHWTALMQATGKEFVPPYEDADMQLGGLLALNLHAFNADVEDICDQATKEEKIELNLEALRERWQAIEFQCELYKTTDVPLLKIQEEDWEALENDQLTVQGMMASRYVKQFEKDVGGWQAALVNISDVFTTVNEIQRTWSYLEPLFIHSDEVKRELPVDAERFAGIDVDIKEVLQAAWATKNIKDACNVEGLLPRLEQQLEALDLCKKSLADFLDGRRRQFPRFYFTSEADLLDILSNGSQPEKVMVHTSKIYLSTKVLKLDKVKRSATDRPIATGWVADVGKESVPFEPPVELEGKVEIYMQTVLDAMKLTLFSNLKRSLIRYNQMPRKDWVMALDESGTRPADPAQIVLMTLAVNYVAEVEEAFTAMQAGSAEAMVDYNALQVDQLADLVRLTQTDIDGEHRCRVMVCITMDAHGRDIVQKLIREKVSSTTAFQWQSQLKHKFRVPPAHAAHQGRDTHLRGDDGQRAEIVICDAILPYDYEYLGNGARLVITPLTDRIYVTATQALNLKMGCAPAGPAGTGKTESTKDLACALAKCCYVFNCSPEMDYKGLGNIFKGLGSSGSWGCFDEFNRLVPEVLSVCTVQFKAVCDGVKAESARITVEGDEVSLDPTCGAFITMNPGYLGRSELPEGLKALFRPMTVMVPDLVLICENMLMANGFVEAKSLASKFYGLYALLMQLLSKQLHYDWGLRAVKSVLVIAGALKRQDPHVSEQEILLRALRDSNIPKIVKEDQVVFYGLLGDLFPGLDPPRKRDLTLESSIVKACHELANWPDDEFCLKCVQLEELLAIRHCVFIMGPAGAGKSQCWRTLAAARKILDPALATTVKDINPKSVKTEELYGFISMATREWRDGLLSVVMRNLGRVEDEMPKWILLDGDLDANWIESMNSVMDDNRMLTLASNERIPLKPHMRMIFEIRDLKHATPATVSRAGILYISTDAGTQWKSLIASYISKRSESDQVKVWLAELCEAYVGESLFWMKINVKTVLPLEDMNLVQSLLHFLTATLDKRNCESKDDLEIVFNFCAVWALGSSLGTSDDGVAYRLLLSDFWRANFKAVKFPSRGASTSVFDYWLNPETNVYESWSKSPFMEDVAFDSRRDVMSQITVPTGETCSVNFWMKKMVDARNPIMLAGPAGTGKTQQVMGMLGKENAAETCSTTINFNFYTTSAVLQTTMALPLEKKTGTNFGPPGQSWLVYFVDDLNLPELDAYNTQSAIALLRQQMEYGHVYDMTKLAQNPLKNISKTQVVACMNPTAGSFEINPRLQRWFVTFAIGMPSRTSLHHIYETFLNGHLESGGFNEEVCALESNIIKAALNLHKEVMEKFRKTATNFHYEFNIRHLANVFQGLLVANADQIQTGEKFVHLWLHESERVYGDRLVSAEHLLQYNGLAQTQAKKLFSQYAVDKFYAKENSEPLIFCHFCDDIEERVYDQVPAIEQLARILEGALELYNETNAVMDLVLFEDAMKHLARIARIILNEGGHALLVGVGGSGKQSLSRLAAFICQYTVTQIVISSTYSINDLKDDLKGMYNKAGLKEEGVMFLLTDSQITNERFLIYINDLLASGNIPDLFAQDDVDNIVNTVANKVKASGKEPDKANCWDYFIRQIRKNLHVVLAFSPVGDDFRNRSRKFPALINSTVIDWFQPWPEEALLSVGQRFLSAVEMGADPKVRDAIEKFMPFSFIEVNKLAKEFKDVERRHVYTTPKSFLELLKLYAGLLEQKRSESDRSITRLRTGLKKMQETSDAVGEIEASLRITLEDAEVKKTRAEGIAEIVSKEKQIVETETAKAEVEAREVSKVQTEVSEKQRSTSEDLAKAEPAVKAAMAALESLDAKSLAECKTMVKPPYGVEDVFVASMCLLAGISPSVTHKNLKIKERTWDAAKKQCLGNIKEYIEYLKMIKVKVDESGDLTVQMKEVRPYLELEHFQPEIIMGKNSAAAGVTSFVINIVMYYDIVVTVEPKRIALGLANKQLEDANARLKVVNELVADLQSKLAKLTDELEKAEAEKAEAMDLVERGQRKLDLAQRLTSALASENERWKESVEIMKASRNLLTGDVLLASAFISYAGPFTKHFRDKLMGQKFFTYLKTAFGGDAVPAEGEADHGMPMSPDLNVLGILTTDADIAVWNQDSLPADPVSTENGTIVSNTARWPLIIDPQLQGIVWLRNKESAAARNLQVVRLGQKDMMRKLERALENGHTILIENLPETLDAVLNPVIQRATIKRGRTLYVKLGDTEVEFHPNFKLYLHTKLSNPHYPPEVQAECTLINFTVTQGGLSDQLLSLVVRKEREDLAELAESLVKQQNGFKIKMKELEDSILEKLANAEGDITEDVALIEGLEETKKISIDIFKKSAAAKETQANIMVTSLKYKPVADRSSALFFLMNDLSKVHSYYVYSLAAFTKVFYRGIDAVTRGTGAKVVGDDGEEEEEEEEVDASELTDAELEVRCEVLKKSITLTSFNYIRRGLFERHKLTVSTMVTLRIAVTDELLSMDDVMYLYVGKIATDPGNMGPLHEWMPEAIWPRVKALEGLKRFAGIGDAMHSDSDEWLSWFDNAAPEVARLPGDYQKTLTAFDRLILIRAMRPDRVSTLMQSYISSTMGPDYVFQQPFDMPATYEETTNQTPVFFVLFPGVDPTPWVEGLGRDKGISTEAGTFCNISMGQGQEKPAEAVLERFAKTGGWVMLQNCHLMTSWVPNLERLLEVVQENAHPDFRCFLSAEPPPALPGAKNMPESLMQASVKVANEAPADIKSNLVRAWANFSQDRIDACTKPDDFKACLFSLCWFHSIVLGRRRFGAQGWSRAYSFNTGDLTICSNVLTSYLDNNPVVPWDDIRYLFGEIMYGGHITDPWDRRTNNTYLLVLMHEDLRSGLELGPGFKSPDPTTVDYQGYLSYVEENLPGETPPQFGLHPNAEIGYLTTTTADLFQTILSLGGGSGPAAGGGDVVKQTMHDLKARCPEKLEMVSITRMAEPLLQVPEQGPYVVCALQECRRMNVLLDEILKTLTELEKGLGGQLNMTQAMEDMCTAFTINQWPGRNPFDGCTWEKFAWPSKKGLLPQFFDLLKRHAQLVSWTETLTTPLSVWLSGLFNPMAYLTGVTQITARATGAPLDKMTQETFVTTYLNPDAIPNTEFPDAGAYVHGLFIEGARWPVGDEVDEVEELGGASVGGVLMESRLKELMPPMPVLYIKAVAVEDSWEASAVGYLRHVPDVYESPVFITTMRGPTYLFLATLKTSEAKSKWTLTGTALMLQQDD